MFRLVRWYVAPVALLAGIIACGRSNDPNGSGGLNLPTQIPARTPLPPLPTEPLPGSEANPLTFIFVVPSEQLSSANNVVDDIIDGLSVEEPDIVFDFRVQSTYGDGFQALCSGEAQVVTLDAFGAIAAQDLNCGEPIYILERDGETSMQSQMITSTGRGIFGTTAFAAQDFCRTDPLSVTGWVVPSLRMEQVGVDPQTELNSVVDAETDEEVIRRVLDFRCDVGATLIGAEDTVTSINPDNVRVIEELPEVPNDSIVLASELSPEVEALMRDVVRNYQDDIADVHNADALQPADDSAYGGLRSLLNDVGVDLESLAK